MKLMVALCFLAVVAGAPTREYETKNVGLTRYDRDSQPDGAYNYSYEQTDGQRRQEQGKLKRTGPDSQALSVKGSYSWVGPDGVEYMVTYEADEEGYKPEVQQGPGGAVSPQLASLLG